MPRGKNSISYYFDWQVGKGACMPRKPVTPRRRGATNTRGRVIDH